MSKLTPNIHVFFAGTKSPLTEINVQIQSGLQRVDLIDASEELLYSAGTKTITITGSEPITHKGLVTNAPSLIFGDSEVAAQLIWGPHTLRVEGFFLDCNLSQSSGGGASEGWTFEAKYEQPNG